MASALISKLKVALKLSISRLRLSQQKETALSKVARRQMAQLLEVGKEESARIRVENIIRQDIHVELMEILELYCELLLARIGLMDAKECDAGLEEAIKTLIYAAPRTEIKELQTVRQLLVEKYGKEFALAAIENSDGKVSERVLKKLRVEPPSENLVTAYLKEIASVYQIPYMVTPSSTPPPPFDDDNPSKGLSELAAAAAAELAQATPPKQMRSPINVAPQSPSTDNVHPTIKLPDPPKYGTQAPKGPPQYGTAQAARGPPATIKKPSAPAVKTLPDDDDLAKRFAALKRT